MTEHTARIGRPVTAAVPLVERLAEVLVGMHRSPKGPLVIPEWAAAVLARALLPVVEQAIAEALRDRGLDPTPETVGDDYRHPHVQRGRICRERADGSGWWPLRWEDGAPNISGGSVCLLPHPHRADAVTREARP